VLLRRFDDAQQFYARAEPFLLAHEAEHNLPLGICSTLIQSPGYFEEPPYLALVEQADQVVVVALRTPPHNLVLSLIPAAALADEALALIARDLAPDPEMLPGVLGPAALSQAFAETWQSLTGRTFHLSLRERIYQLTAVQPVTGVPGAMRRATEADHDLLVRWIGAFNTEAKGTDDHAEAERWVARLFTSPLREVYLWEDGKVVSLACYGGPTPHGMRIGPVYTPPEQRGKGYASACVAALSQMLLDGGRRFCFLFTDLANPTSNHIYQVIGYQPVCDVAVYQFSS